jgi:hypothetical protein
VPPLLLLNTLSFESTCCLDCFSHPNPLFLHNPLKLAISLLHAVVFKMHYNELLARNEEVEKLKAIIEGLSRA